MTLGLVVFVAVVFLNSLGLLLDLWLYLSGHKTITDWVWDIPRLGWPILMLQVAGLVGLAEHFYWSAE